MKRAFLALPGPMPVKAVLAIIIVLFAFVLAKIVSFSLTKALQAAHLDERLSKLGGLVTREGRLSQTIGALAFWFIMVVGIIQSLAALEMQSLVQPLERALEGLDARMRVAMASASRADELRRRLESLLGAGEFLLEQLVTDPGRQHR